MDVNERCISKKDVKKTSKQIDFLQKKMTSKRKYIKSGEYTKEAILKRKMNRIFGKFEKLHEQEGENWYKKLANTYKPIEELKRHNSKFVYRKKKIYKIRILHKRCNITKENY